MSERVTRKDLEQTLERLCGAIGRPYGHYRECAVGESNMGPRHTFTTIPGGWALQHGLNGYVIHQLADVPGETWIHEPMGSRRRSGREMLDAMQFALYALHARTPATI